MERFHCFFSPFAASRKNFLTFLLAAFFFFTFAPAAFAACTAPAANAGEMLYNSDWHVPQYCDNTNWIGMGKATATNSAFTYKATNTTNSTNARDVWGDGAYIYVADSAGGIDAYSFNGAAFTYLATNTTNSTSAQGVWGDGTYIYVADNTGGIDAYTFNGTTFTFKATDTTNTTGARRVWGDGTYIYVADYNVGITAYTFNGTAFTFKTSSITNSTNPSDVWGDGTYIYVADSANIDAYTFNGTAFTFLATNATSTQAIGAWSNAGNIYIADFTGGIDAYRFNATAFTFKATNTTNSTGARDVWGDSTYVYVADGGGGIDAYTFSCINPAGGEGDIMYNAAQRVMQYCNGTAWQAMGSNGGTWKQISTGQSHTCAIKSDDTLWCWGDNGSGRLGDGTSTIRLVPTAVSGGGTWKQVSAGDGHTCGIKSDDTLWCWGQNTHGALGDNTTTGKLIPTAINGGGTWKQVDAGGFHTCGIKTDDSLWCWGSNLNGGVGDNTTIDKLIPTAVNGGGTWKLVSASGYNAGPNGNTCGIKTDDSLWCWGYNGYGQIGDNTNGTNRLIPTAINGGGTWKLVSVGSRHACGIKTDDSLWCWGRNTEGQLGDNSTTDRWVPTAINGGGTWKQISGGGLHTCGIKTDSTLWCWGNNTEGQIGDGTATNRLIPTAVSGGGTWKQIATSNITNNTSDGSHTCGITTDNTVLCWGYNTEGQLGDNSSWRRLVPTAINGPGTWKQVSADGGGATNGHTCGIKTNATLWCWGTNFYGQIGDNTSGADRIVPTAVNGGGTWKQVSAGGSHTCGIKSDDTVWCWGGNAQGQIGDNTCCTNRLIPTAINGGGTWKQVSAGNSHTCGIKTDDSLWCWGANSSGQLGDNSTTQRWVPTAINGGGTWKQVSTGYIHTCGIKTDDSLWCWGDNTNGQIGDNTSGTDRLVPTAINGGGTWKQFSTGGLHTCGIMSDDTLWCWGYNGYGQIGDNTSGTDRLVPTAINGGGTWKQVSAGGVNAAAHTCGIKTDDTLWCWGNNANGQLGDNSTTQRLAPTATYSGTWKQVSAGGAHTCGIKSDNTLSCWGPNTDGQLTATDESAPYRITGVLPWCVNPSAKPGTMLYNNDFNRLQFCNGGGWMSVGK